MKILVVDGQGGGIGRQIVESVKNSFPKFTVICVGTNSLATNAMLKAGADFAATGENAVVVNAKKADIIIGPVGMVIADSLMGEITAKMSQAIAMSNAKRIIIPMNHCDNIIVGCENIPISELINKTIEQIRILS